MFKGWTARHMNDVLHLINNEIPYNKSGLNLEPDEVIWYNKSIADLKRDRAKYPNVPIAYGPEELDWE